MYIMYYNIGLVRSTQIAPRVGDQNRASVSHGVLPFTPSSPAFVDEVTSCLQQTTYFTFNAIPYNSLI